MSLHKSIEQILESAKVGDLIPPKNVITVSADATVSDAIQILSTNGILSAPVADPKLPDNNKYIGFLDMFDILSYVLKSYTEDKTTLDGTQLHIWCQNISKLNIKGEEFARHTVRELIGVSKLNPFVTISRDALLPELIYLFTRGPHRAAVVESDGSLSAIATQSAIVQFLAKHINHYGKVARANADQIGFLKKVAKISQDSRAIHAFHFLMREQVSSVAIVDDSGVISANLSVTDLKGLTQENFGDLLLPVIEFLRKTKRLHPPICVRPETSFETIVLKLAVTKVHRVWVVDDYERPIGIVSLTDVMRLLDLRIYIDSNGEEEK